MAQTMAKSFHTPTKSAKCGRWDGFPLRERMSLEPIAKAQTPKANSSGIAADRFITDRSAMDLKMANYLLSKENSTSEAISPSKEVYRNQLVERLLNAESQSRILPFKSKPPPPPEGFENGLKTLFPRNVGAAQTKPTKMFVTFPKLPR